MGGGIVHFTFYPKTEENHFPNSAQQISIFQTDLARITLVSDQVPNAQHVSIWGFTRGRFAWFGKISSTPLCSHQLSQKPCPAHTWGCFSSSLLSPPCCTPRRTSSCAILTLVLSPGALILLIFHRHLLVFHRCQSTLLIRKGVLFTNFFVIFLVKVNSCMEIRNVCTV